MLDPQALEALIGDGDVDTVLVAFPDLQGRLIGKRVTGHFFLEHVASGDGAIEACNYLLAVDVDMTPLPGYEFANWEHGLRRLPLRARSRRRCASSRGSRRPRSCSATSSTSRRGEPVEVSPRRILQRQIERAADARLPGEVRRRSSSSSSSRTPTRRRRRSDFHGPDARTPAVIEDYHILQTTRDEYLIRQIRNGMDGAGVPVEFSKGEAGRGQHEINLRYADALEMADRHAIYKNGAKEIADLNGRSLTFMAKYSMDEVGSSCHIHSSLWDADGARVADVGRGRARPPVAGVPRLARRPGRDRPRAARGCSPRP